MDVDLTEVPGGRVDLPRDEGIEVDDALNEGGSSTGEVRATVMTLTEIILKLLWNFLLILSTMS